MKINSPVLEKRKAGRPTVDRTDEILDAAERLYGEIGFEKTTMGDVARALSMSPANLYRSFASRRAIDEAVGERRLRRIEDAAWAAARRAANDPTAAFRELAYATSRETVEVLFKNGRMSQLCLVASREQWTIVRDYQVGLHGAVRHVLAEGVRLGQFRDDLDIETTASAILDAMTRVWQPVVVEMYGAKGLEPRIDRLSTLILDAITARKDPPNAAASEHLADAQSDKEPSDKK